MRARGTRHWKKLRREALSRYGGSCACCGESRYEFLALDHINGGGNKLRGGNLRNEEWARRNGWPPVLRVLCHNCNMARGFYGVCPHELERTAEAVLAA